MKKDKSDKPKTFTAREAAQDFIRPFIMKGDTVPLHPSANLRHDSEHYSARIEGEKVMITKLCGADIMEEFSLKEIMRDVVMEYNHLKGLTNIHASTAKEAYAIRDKEVKELIRILNAKLKDHRAMFKKNMRNWGYVGDMAHIQETLKELVAFLH